MKTQTKPDRRAVRSKRLIIEALRELILEKDYKKISVSDIVKRADIGRATFYAHFEDKEDLGKFFFSQLMAQIELEIQTSLEENNSDNNDFQNLAPSLALFRVAEKKHRWFKQNGANSNSGLGMLIKPLVRRMEAQLDVMNYQHQEDDIPRQLLATYLISALIAILTDWVMEDMPETPEVMDAIYQSLAEPTLNRLLGI